MVHGELWGITAEGWVAIATLASGAAVLAGIWFGARQFLRQQEASDVRRYLVEDGAWKLKESLDHLLQTVTLNHAAALHLTRLARDLPVGQPGAPSREDLPRLFPIGALDFAFSAIGPTSRVLNSQQLGVVATKAFACLFNMHAVLTSEVEQTIRTYYSGGMHLDDDQRVALVRRLNDLTERKFAEIRPYWELPRWIEDAGLRVQELKISRFTDTDLLHNDHVIVDIREMIIKLAKELESVDDAVETGAP